MNHTRHTLRWALLCLVAAYLAAALYNNRAQEDGPAPAAKAAKGDSACPPYPSVYFGLPPGAPPKAQEVERHLLGQLRESALLGETEAAGGASRKSLTAVGSALLAAYARYEPAGIPYFALTLVDRCSGEVRAAGLIPIEEFPPAAAAAALRSQLVLAEGGSPLLLWKKDLRVAAGISREFGAFLEQCLRRSILKTGIARWAEPALLETLPGQAGLPAGAPLPHGQIFVQIAGDSASLWGKIELRDAAGTAVLSELPFQRQEALKLFSGLPAFLRGQAPLLRERAP